MYVFLKRITLVMVHHSDQRHSEQVEKTGGDETNTNRESSLDVAKKSNETSDKTR